MGFPTVNLRLSELDIRLPLGVYEVAAAGMSAVANYGFAPTMGESRWRSPVLELHFLGSPADIPSEGRIEVAFVRFIRPERVFASVDDLKAQLARDVARAASDFA